MSFKKTSMALIASTLLVTTLSARDQIKIVGSSTVYPFSSSVAEEFGATTSFPTPVVESTGNKTILCWSRYKYSRYCKCFKTNESKRI